MDAVRTVTNIPVQSIGIKSLPTITGFPPLTQPAVIAWSHALRLRVLGVAMAHSKQHLQVEEQLTP